MDKRVKYFILSIILIALGNYDEVLGYINNAYELDENNELLDELIEEINKLSINF